MVSTFVALETALQIFAVGWV